MPQLRVRSANYAGGHTIRFAFSMASAYTSGRITRVTVGSVSANRVRTYISSAIFAGVSRSTTRQSVSVMGSRRRPPGETAPRSWRRSDLDLFHHRSYFRAPSRHELLRGTASLSPSKTYGAREVRRLRGFAHGRGSGNFFQLAGSYVVNVSVDRNRLGNQRMVANAPDVRYDGRRIILHGEPIDKLTFRRPRPLPDIAKAVGGELGGLETTGKEIPHHLVGEEQHAAVGVVDDEELIRAEQLVRDDQGAKRVVARAPSGVANDVRISLRESGVLGRIQSGIHACENRKVARWRYGQLALRAERRCIARIRLQNFW